MPSPAKKRKLNKPTRGLEYFFQKQNEAKEARDKEEGKGKEEEKIKEDYEDKEDKQVDRETNDTIAPADSQTTDTLPLDESPLTFDPERYAEALQREWSALHGYGAPYALLVRCFVLVSATTSRIAIVDTLVNTLRILLRCDPARLRPAVWLSTNAIAPAFVLGGGGGGGTGGKGGGSDLGLGYAAIAKALRQACGLDAQQLKTLMDRHGDPGDVAYHAQNRQRRQTSLRRPQPLTIQGVYDSLVAIRRCQGPRSTEAKQRLVDRLLQDARSGDESRFVVRTLCRHLRIGAVQSTMLTALSRAFLLASDGQPTPLSLKRAEDSVKACFARRPDYDDLVAALLEVGVVSPERLDRRLPLQVHTPLRPMLGAITRDLADMRARLRGHGAFVCEFKYDGQRAQVHGSNEKVSLFSRHLEDMTVQYPEVVRLMKDQQTPSNYILEGELVAVDSTTGALRNFQTLASRSRTGKTDANTAAASAAHVCLFVFDLMLLDGVSLLDRPLRERRALLRERFVEVPRRFVWVESMDVEGGEEEEGEEGDVDDAIEAFFKKAVESKCEGIMVKKPLLATYEPDKRLASWLKVKKDYGGGADTVDLVPVAAWHGSGRKAAFWSPFLLATRSEATGRLEAVTKCMSGFTDAFYRANKAYYEEEENERNEETEIRTTPGTKPPPMDLDYSGPLPDVWFYPNEVWETAFADITLSPTYTAGLGLASQDRGLSLRFPRFLRKRDDKSVDEASSSEYLVSLYRKQEARGE